MELRNFSIEQYKGYTEWANVALAPLTILVGPHNCGKTALAQAIQLLVGGLAPLEKDTYERRSQNRPQSGDAKPCTGGAKLDRPGGPRSIPEVFCGTPEGCIKWSYTLKYGAVSSSRG